VTRPPVSAIVVSYNVRSQLLETLGAYYSTCGADAEVVVVDNASSDGSAAAVEAAFPQTTLVRLDENVGFGSANNVGLTKCSGEQILLLNPDVLVKDGCVKTLAGFLAAHPEAGAVGPRLERPDGRLDLAARRAFPSPLSAFYRFAGLSRMFPNSRRFNRYNLGALPPDAVHEIDTGTAACLMVRRQAIDQVGFFDPQFFMFGEDIDLCYRLRQSGWKIYYEPAAVAVHLKGSSTRQDTGRMLYEFHRAMWLFHRKHYAASTPAVGNAFVWAGIWTRWAVLRARAWITRDARISP
jgi:GT2 family glycosyltransferase